MQWDRMIAAAVTGGALGLLFGYWSFKSGRAVVTFHDWLTGSYFGGPTDAVLFAGLGAIAAVAITHLARHNSN